MVVLHIVILNYGLSVYITHSISFALSVLLLSRRLCSLCTQVTSFVVSCLSLYMYISMPSGL